MLFTISEALIKLSSHLLRIKRSASVVLLRLWANHTTTRKYFYHSAMSTTEAAIDSVRARFEKELATVPDSFHPIDIERVRNDQWQVKRFLLHYGNDEAAAAEALFKALRWKKEYGIHNRDDRYFPRELFEMSGAEICGRDKEGRLIHWGVIKNMRHFPEAK